MSQTNEFLKIRRLIDNAVSEYKKVLEECHVTQKWHSETIARMSAPFLKGCFTLAIVGKMSSGKSTFINTLIGEDLLPTGHFQTTSAITYIENAKNPKMVVRFCDGHTQEYVGESIKASLRKLVSVAPEYSDLPCTHINDLIAGGDTLSEVLSKRFEIAQKTRTKDSKDLWESYYKTHPKSEVAERVDIFYPLSEDFVGWRIVDTPGIGAIGGIQDETKRLFAERDENNNKLVDAIIFLQRGDDNIEDSTNVEFVENTFSQLSEEAKERLFFVLTHATTQKFRQQHDEIMGKAKSIYAEKYSISPDRLTCVDSLMTRFHQDLSTQRADVSTMSSEDDIEPLDGWNEKEWECMLELLSPLKKALKHQGLARNNENLYALMEEWGNFHTLKTIINAFVKKVKEESALEIVNLIKEDYKAISDQIQEEIKILEGGEPAIKAKKEEMKRKRVEYNNIINKLRRSAAIEPILKKFSFVDSELSELNEKKSIDEVRIAYQNIMDRGLKKEKEMFGNLESDFSSFCKGYDPKDITLRSIDFSSLVHAAHSASSHTEKVYKEETYRTGGMSPKTKTRQVYAGTKEVTDYAKKLREFKALVLREARKITDSFMAQLKERVKLLCDYVEADIKKKNQEVEGRLNELETTLADKQEQIATLKTYLSLIPKN